MRALIQFGKCERLRFISHLDLQRFFQRALSRTGLPIAYSQGFNPHPVMSFASALAVGWTSEYEVLDIKLACPMGRGRTEEAMRSALPEDLPVLNVRLVDDRFPASMALVTHADYQISFLTDGANELYNAVPEFLKREEVLGIRKTKSGEREINVRALAMQVEPRGDHLFARLKLSERDTLKPDVLVTALSGIAEIPVPKIGIHRTCLLTGSEGQELIPLMNTRSLK